MHSLQIKLNPNYTLQSQTIKSGHECLIIDDFLDNAEEVIAWAETARPHFLHQERAYPGLILPLDESVADPLHRFIRSELSRAFGFLRGGIDFQTQVSLTTMQPEDFSWIQCLPHSDPRQSADRVNYATVLYLFEDQSLGGTGFYRWRDLEFWQDMTQRQLNDPEGGLELLRERFEMFRKPWQYTTESNEAVELLTMVPARFNRIICYSGDIPHNAFVSHPERLTDDPRSGRLTLNSFASVLPRA